MNLVTLRTFPKPANRLGSWFLTNMNRHAFYLIYFNIFIIFALRTPLTFL